MTDYVILKSDESPEHEAWRPVAEVDAHSREQAIAIAVRDLPGRWKAVPKRSWEGGSSHLPEQIVVKRDLVDPSLPGRIRTNEGAP